MHASLFLAALLAAQPVATATTPLEALQIIRFNAAQADEALLHRVVEITAQPTGIYRDGTGGYILRFDDAITQPVITGRIEVHCYFPATARTDLARILPGEIVTIRGIPRRALDRLHALIDPSVRLEVKDCVVVATRPAEPLPPTPAQAP